MPRVPGSSMMLLNMSSVRRARLDQEGPSSLRYMGGAGVWVQGVCYGLGSS